MRVGTGRMLSEWRDQGRSGIGTGGQHACIYPDLGGEGERGIWALSLIRRQ